MTTTDLNEKIGYVYRHIRKDTNEVFYIGIGSSKYRAYSKQYRNKHWHNIVAKTDYEAEIMIENIPYSLAKIKEIEFISLYGRRDLKTGTLVNKTIGGDGVVGNVVSEESKKKMSLAKKGIKSRLGKVVGKEGRLKMSIAQKGKRNSAVLVYNIENGIFHQGIDEAAKTYGYNYSTLKQKLTGRRTNNTPIRYA